MGRTIFRNVTVFDGLGEQRSGQSVVVESGRITAVASTETGGQTPDDLVVDGLGRSLLPGMYLCHFHATYHEILSRFGPMSSGFPPSFLAVVAARNLKLALDHGFTGVVSAGGAFDIEPGLGEAIDAGIIAGPRFTPCGRELSTTGHSNDIAPWYWGHVEAGGIRLCDSAEGFRLGVRQEIKRGAKIIKLFVTGGHGVFSDRDRVEMTWDEMAAAVEAAHSRGVLIRGHIANKRAIMKAIELGVDIIDHCDEIDDEVIAALAETGTYIVPSLQLPQTILTSGMGEMMGFDPAAVQADIDRMCAALPAAHEAGVRVLLGDDYGAPGLDHGSYGSEFRTYVEGTGMPVHQILSWATINAARLLGTADELGSIEVGKIADLVLIEGNPAEDISLLADRQPTAVLMNGVTVAGTLPTREHAHI